MRSILKHSFSLFFLLLRNLCEVSFAVWLYPSVFSRWMENGVLICIIATFLKISMQHNLYLRRILPFRFVHFAVGGHTIGTSALHGAALPWSSPRRCFFPYSLITAAQFLRSPASIFILDFFAVCFIMVLCKFVFALICKKSGKQPILAQKQPIFGLQKSR